VLGEGEDKGGDKFFFRKKNLVFFRGSSFFLKIRSLKKMENFSGKFSEKTRPNPQTTGNAPLPSPS
jgi:hypothetical protein